MSLNILADEGVNGNIVKELRDEEYSIEWVMEISPGITDLEVFNLAKSNKQILLTEDKDFGEWIFAHNLKGLTIIFLRYEKDDFPQIMEFLKGLIKELADTPSEEKYFFITINKNKVRRREII